MTVVLVSPLRLSVCVWMGGCSNYSKKRERKKKKEEEERCVESKLAEIEFLQEKYFTFLKLKIRFRTFASKKKKKAMMVIFGVRQNGALKKSFEYNQSLFSLSPRWKVLLIIIGCGLCSKFLPIWPLVKHNISPDINLWWREEGEGRKRRVLEYRWIWGREREIDVNECVNACLVSGFSLKLVLLTSLTVL